MTMTRSRMGLLPGLLLALALALAACGGGDKGEGVASRGGDSTQAALAYARCMR
jgi:hypothetical protein